MHCDNGHSGVDGVDAAVGHIGRHGAAAALVHLAQLAGLPDNPVLGENLSDSAYHLGGGVAGAGFSAAAGKFAYAKTVIEPRIVGLFADLRIGRIKGVGDVGGNAEGAVKAVAQYAAVSAAEILHEVFKGAALHARNADGADFLLVRQYAYGGVLRLFRFQNGSQLRVGAYPVVMAVSGNHTAVKAHVSRHKARHYLQLRGEEILLGNAVFFVQNGHHVELEAVAGLGVRHGAGAYHKVKVLAGYGGIEGLLALLCGQMRQKVGNNKGGVAGLVADGLGEPNCARGNTAVDRHQLDYDRAQAHARR